MIRSITSSLKTFKSLSFQPGLNVLLADVTSKSTDKQTRNSAGKTSVIEVIHFLLGSDADKNSLFKKSDIAQSSFTGKFFIRNSDVVVTRSGADEKKIFVDANVIKALGLVPSRDENSGRYYVDLDDWKEFLGAVWFGLPADRASSNIATTFSPTYRSLISYFARRRRSGGYSSIQKHHEFQQPWDYQVNLSYLLGLDWRIPQEMQDLKARKKTLLALRQAISDGELGAVFGTSAEIRPEMARTEERLARLKLQIDRFEVLDQYRELADEVASLKSQMSDLTFKIASLKETIAFLSKSKDEEKPPAYADVKKLYQAAGVELPNVALRRFDDVQAFQRSVTENRRGYLRQQIEDAQTELGIADAELAAKDARKSELVKLLEGKGAYDALMKLHEERAVLMSRAETLRIKLQNANILESDIANQKRESAELEAKLQADHARNEDAIKNATVKVDQAISALYDDRTGNLIIEATKSGPRFSIEIQGDGNQGGIDLMKIFCFDTMLLATASERFGGPHFLVHDSHLFDGVDARQVRAAIKFGAGVAAAHSAQYIITMNSDDYLRSGVGDEAELARAVLPVKLTDDETGGLFGFRFD